MCGRGGIDHRLTRSIDDLFCVKSRDNSARLPQNTFWSAFSRYRASFAEPQGSSTRFPKIRRHGLILNATAVASAPEGVMAVASWMRRRRNERGLSGLIVPHLQPLSKTLAGRSSPFNPSPSSAPCVANCVGTCHRRSSSVGLTNSSPGSSGPEAVSMLAPHGRPKK